MLETMQFEMPAKNGEPTLPFPLSEKERKLIIKGLEKAHHHVTEETDVRNLIEELEKPAPKPDGVHDPLFLVTDTQSGLIATALMELASPVWNKRQPKKKAVSKEATEADELFTAIHAVELALYYITYKGTLAEMLPN
jgi:hypothetical protein